MLSDEKIQEWRQNKCTQALLSNFIEAKESLQQDLVYEENTQQIFIMQGLIRAYIDAINVILDIKNELIEGLKDGQSDE